MHIVLFNGPPHVGKDTIANALYSKLMDLGICSVQYKFAGCMKRALQGFFDLSDEMYKHYFETDAKNHPQDKFLGKTPRAALISFSEDWVKNYFGIKTFGQIAGQRFKEIEEDFGDNDFILITDSGFYEELDGLFEYINPKDCILYRLHRDGTDFVKDSRSYLVNENRVLMNNSLDNNRDVEYVVADILVDLKDRGIV